MKARHEGNSLKNGSVAINVCVYNGLFCCREREIVGTSSALRYGRTQEKIYSSC